MAIIFMVITVQPLFTGHKEDKAFHICIFTQSSVKSFEIKKNDNENKTDFVSFFFYYFLLASPCATCTVQLLNHKDGL